MARHHGVCKETIDRIEAGEIWADVPPRLPTQVARRPKNQRYSQPQIVLLPKSARPIPGIDGYYVSAGGKVYSRRWKWLLTCFAVNLRPTLSRQGYLWVCVGKRQVSVHRLVAEVFLGLAPPGATLVRHLNGNSIDNRRANLAWGTSFENAADRDRHGRTARGATSAVAKMTEAQALEIKQLARAGLRQREIAERVGVSRGMVSNVVRGIAWKSVGPAMERRRRSSPVRGLKLSRDQVAEIKLRLEGGEARSDLAREFDVSSQTVGKIDRGETWRDVEPGPSPRRLSLV